MSATTASDPSDLHVKPAPTSESKLLDFKSNCCEALEPAAWLVATLSQLDEPMPHYICAPNDPSFAELERRFPGLSIRSTTHCLQACFDSVTSARAWCKDIATRFPDEAVMVGFKSELLVRRFPWFRMNVGLYNIVQYIWVRKLVFDLLSKRWTNLVKTPLARAQLDCWIQHYQLNAFH